MRVKKFFLIAAGCVSIFLGSLGIILPGLPTTPFLLLAAWCFANSSDKFHHWLVNHKIFGPYITDFKETGGVQMRIKVVAILFMWAGLAISFFQLENQLMLTVIVFLVLFGTILLTLVIPTAPAKNSN